VLFTMKKKIIIILTTYNIGRYNIDNKKSSSLSLSLSLLLLLVVGWGGGGLFPTCAAGVIYFQNNATLVCPISSAGWCVII
jgi:hypothetical protein